MVSSQYIWTDWCDVTATTTNATWSAVDERTNTIWHTWTNGPRSTYVTASTTNTVWAYWSGQTTYFDESTQFRPIWNPTPLSEAELAEARRRREVAIRAERSRMDELIARAEAAERRAEQLLVENLSLRQREEYLKHRAFTVHGRQARYRIRKGRSGNVDVVNEQGLITHRLCAHPGKPVPDYDTMLAQKLMLEFDEVDFVRRANVHPLMGSPSRVMEALH